MRDGAKFRLGDLCSITKGETPIKQAVPGRYPLVVTASERATHETFQFDCRAVIVPLVSSTGHGHASIKRIHYQEGKFALGSILCAVVPKDEKRLNPQFLHVYFSYFKDQLIVPLMKGSANVSLAVSTLANLEIIVPPMDVQMRVVSLSQNDVLMKPLENEIAHQEALLGKLKQAILQDAIQGKLTDDWRAANPDTEPASELLKRIQKEKLRLIADKKLRPEKPLPKISPAEIPFEIPESWEWCWLGEMIELVSGQHIEAADYNEQKRGAPYLTGPSDFGEKHPTYTRWTEKPKVTAKGGDLLVTVKGSGVGKMNVLLDNGVAIGRQLMAVRPFIVNEAFIASYLHSQYVKFQDAKEGQIPGIGRDDILKKLIPLPPLAEQAAIVERVEALMAHCRALETEIEHSRTHAAHLLQAVLKEAFSPAS
jgi:type I restriction enzyme S subunit